MKSVKKKKEALGGHTCTTTRKIKQLITLMSVQTFPLCLSLNHLIYILKNPGIVFSVNI